MKSEREVFILNLIEKIIGTYSQREVKRIMPLVEEVMALEDKYTKLSETELKGKTAELKKRLENGETLDDILPDAFATMREAAWRVLGMKHFKVQVIGGIILHQGRIAEMRTGEGKTLVATLPVYLNALTGKGVHVITVNDYLAKRDSDWMGKVYKYLGLSVGLVIHGISHADKKAAYSCDITYGTNNEFGFDYLRDNMVTYKDQMVQRELNYAIVDEVDSILVDEARTPLIISAPAEKSTDMYKQADRFVRTLKAKIIVESNEKEIDDGEEVGDDYDYIVDLKAHSATLVSRGTKKAEQYFNIENLSDPENGTIAHHINQALKAHGIMKNEKDYVIKDGQIIIVDEFTGRLMFGRRYNEGLHQAIEAKENLQVQNESKTLATITFQNYFRMYSKLSGMTGTAMTEEDEFQSIYKLDVVEIPTNKPTIRKDMTDIVYKSEKGKFRAVVEEIKESHEKGQPVLVGTVTIEKSEELSKMLKREGIRHEVLNAKYHEKEAAIISQAGKFGAVTIATNMAGRGTDIMLGGNSEFLAKQEMRKQGFSEELIVEATGFAETDDTEILKARERFQELNNKYKEQIEEERQKVIDAGGLKVIGTERHESRRIDNQLRGRSGRQGDPGESRFFISLEDDLMKLFGGERIISIVDAIGGEEMEDVPIEMRMVSNSIENAQKKVEGRNFSIRKSVLQFDNVMNTQRDLIYKDRRRVLFGENMTEQIRKMVESVAEDTILRFTTEKYVEDWDFEALKAKVADIFNIPDFEVSKDRWDDLTREQLTQELSEKVMAIYDNKEKEFGEDEFREVERVILLRVVDEHWMEHIDAMDQLKQGIYIRGYAQKDPVVEYKFEGNQMFEEMTNSIQENVVKAMFRIQKNRMVVRHKVDNRVMNESRGDDGEPQKPKTAKKSEAIGRNEPCPCGSGKKYKKCCGQSE